MKESCATRCHLRVICQRRAASPCPPDTYFHPPAAQFIVNPISNDNVHLITLVIHLQISICNIFVPLSAVTVNLFYILMSNVKRSFLTVQVCLKS